MATDPAQPQPVARLPWSVCFWFGVGTNGTSTLIGVTGIFLLFFMTTLLGINPALAGGLIFAVKAYDIVIAPVIGYVSDRSETRIGRRRPYMLAGAVLAGFSCYLMFAVPRFDSQLATLAYYTFALLVFATGYPIFSVPYLSMPAEMTADYHERTRLMSFRTLFGAVGLLLGTAVAPVLVGIGGGSAAAGIVTAAPQVLRPADPALACVLGEEGMRAGGSVDGYAFMGAVLGVVVLASMLLCFFGTARAPFARRTSTQMGFVQQLRLTARNKPFVLLVTAKIMQLTGVTAFSASLAFYAQYVVQMKPAELAMFFGLFSLGSMLSIPGWVMASRRFGKKAAYVFAVSLFVLFDLGLLAGKAGSVGLVVSLGFMIGIAGGGLILLGVSMLPDTIEYDFRTTGERREGLYAGVWSIIETGSAGIATLLTGVLLSAAGFIETRAGQIACQPLSAVNAVALAVAVAPAAIMLASLYFLLRYDLSEQRLGALRGDA